MRLRLALLFLSIAGLTSGVAWWVAPGAGVALGSVALGVWALLTDDGKTPAEPLVRRQDKL